jgi:Flp pilus assembly protein TadG
LTPAARTTVRARSRRTAAAPRRAGVAATELAVCMPLLVLIVLATMEACAMIFLQQSLSVAAYEGARVGITPKATSSDVAAQCQQILDDREVQSATVSVSPTNIPGAAAGTWIEVEATAPFSDNAVASGWLFGGRKLTATVQMIKER